MPIRHDKKNGAGRDQKWEERFNTYFTKGGGTHCWGRALAPCGVPPNISFFGRMGQFGLPLAAAVRVPYWHFACLIGMFRALLACFVPYWHFACLIGNLIRCLEYI